MRMQNFVATLLMSLLLPILVTPSAVASAPSCGSIFSSRFSPGWWEKVSGYDQLEKLAYKFNGKFSGRGYKLEEQMQEHFKLGPYDDLRFLVENKEYKSLKVLFEYGDGFGDNPHALFHKLNAALRSGEVPAKAKTMQKALDLLPPVLTSTDLVYRGMTLSRAELQHAIETAQYSNPSFLSTSLDPSIATNFLPHPSNLAADLVSVFAVIKGKSGKYIRPFVSGELSSEQEVLFSPGRRFHITKIKNIQGDNVFIFEMTEL